MYDTTAIILADLKEFPHAQHYAACFSVLFSDIGRRSERGAYKPDRQDYTKVYIVSKDKALVDKFKEAHLKFDVEVYDDIPDYTGQDIRKVASKLLATSCVDPFDDLKAMREKELKQAELDKTVKAAEKQGVFLDPNPNVKLARGIKLTRKGDIRDA